MKLKPKLNKMKTHLTTEDVYNLAYDKLDVSNIKVDKEMELAQILDLECDEEADAYLNPDIYYCFKCSQPQDHSFSSSCCGAIASYDPKGTGKVINVMHCCNAERREGTLRHKAKVLTKEEVVKGRSNAYRYLEL